MAAGSPMRRRGEGAAELTFATCDLNSHLGRRLLKRKLGGMANTPRYEHDPGRHCIYCQHVIVRVLIPSRNGRLGCEKNRGHAGEEQYHVCCDFRRDDEDIAQRSR